MKNFNISVFDKDNQLIDLWGYKAQTPKGVEKMNKKKFRLYRENGYTWEMEEDDNKKLTREQK